MNRHRRLTYGIAIVSIISCILLVFIFKIVLKEKVYDKAYNSLSYYRYLTEEDEVYGDTDEYFMISYVDQELIEEELSNYNEDDLFEYFLSNEALIDVEEIYDYTTDYSHMFFMLSYYDDDVILYYINVYPMEQVINQSSALLMFFMVIAVLFILLLSFRSTKIMDASEMNTKNFFANASHELKTPIMSIGGYAEGLEKGLVDNETAASVILNECQRMEKLVGNILELSKIDSGVTQLDLVEIDIRELVYDALDAQRLIIKSKSLNLNLKMEDTVYHLVDETLMGSVITNIINNGIRYAESVLEVEIKTLSNRVEIQISNDGPSIDRNEQKKIFNRFYKGQNGKTGIGLSLSLAYVNLHHGSIEIASENNWTTFKITLPR